MESARDKAFAVHLPTSCTVLSPRPPVKMRMDTLSGVSESLCAVMCTGVHAMLHWCARSDVRRRARYVACRCSTALHATWAKRGATSTSHLNPIHPSLPIDASVHHRHSEGTHPGLVMTCVCDTTFYMEFGTIFLSLVSYPQ